MSLDLVNSLDSVSGLDLDWVDVDVDGAVVLVLDGISVLGGMVVVVVVVLVSFSESWHHVCVNNFCDTDLATSMIWVGNIAFSAIAIPY